jgi:hypothetical protein
MMTSDNTAPRRVRKVSIRWPVATSQTCSTPAESPKSPPEWTDTGSVEVYTVRHAALADADATMAALRNKLSPVDLGATLHPSVEIGLGVADITAANKDFPVTAHSDREDLLLHAALIDPDTGQPVHAAPLRPIGDGDYTATLVAPPGLWRIEVTAIAELPPVTVSDLVLCS